jgi:TatA/E family protein of Tat protein translocase
VVGGLFSPGHLLVILAVAFLVFGPEKLPEIARQIAKVSSDVRRFQASLKDEVEGAFDWDQPRSPLSPATPQPPAVVPPAEASGAGSAPVGAPRPGGNPVPPSAPAHRQEATPDTGMPRQPAGTDDEHPALAFSDKEHA